MVPTVGYSGMTEPLPIAISLTSLRIPRTGIAKDREREECAGLEVEELIVHGEAASEIVRVAKDRGRFDCCFIAWANRIGRIIFGSTAEAVVRHAHAPYCGQTVAGRNRIPVSSKQ